MSRMALSEPSPLSDQLSGLSPHLSPDVHRDSPQSSALLRLVMIGCALVLSSCSGSNNGQPIDVSKFDEFTFSRAIEIDKCFAVGDLLSLTMTSQVDNRLLIYTALTAAQDEEADCLVVTEEGDCLVESETTTRVLVQSENTRVDNLFRNVMIANEPRELCSAGNVTLCSEDLYIWDGLTVSADFCQPVYMLNGFEVMDLLKDLRDGPPDESEQNNFADSVFATTPIEITSTELVIVSDQVLGKNGDFVVIRTQSDLDGALAQDGSAQVDFENHIGVIVVVIRPPCREFTGIEGVETLLTVEISGTMERDDDCSFDLGSIDAFLITIPKTPKKIRLFLNNSELDEIHL